MVLMFLTWRLDFQWGIRILGIIEMQPQAQALVMDYLPLVNLMHPPSSFSLWGYEGYK